MERVTKAQVPLEPSVVTCKRCGEQLWSVIGPNGMKLTLDRFQIETHVRPTGLVRRVRMPNRHLITQRVVRNIGGYRLAEPRWFSGWSDERPGWLWYASRMSLEDAEVHGVVIYSDHQLTCAAASDASIMGKATASGLEGDAAGNRDAKRVYALPEEMRNGAELWLKFPAKLLKPRQMSAIKTPTKREEPMPLFEALSAARVASVHRATEPTRPEAAQTQLDLWS